MYFITNHTHFASVFKGIFIYFLSQDLFIDIFGTSFFLRIDRLLDWSNSSGYQLENGLTAIGSGGLFGFGFGNTPIYFPEPQTDFINVTVWNKQAENVAKYLAKGRQIAVEGRIQTRNYDNNEGKKTYVTEVIASNVEFLGSANDNNRVANNNAGFDENPFDAEPVMDTTSIDNDPFASFGEKVEISDSELPF